MVPPGAELGIGVLQTAILAEIMRRLGATRARLDTVDGRIEGHSDRIAENEEQLDEHEDRIQRNRRALRHDDDEHFTPHNDD